MEHNLLDAQTQRELLSWYDIITKQNNFIKKNDVMIQNNGLGMGAPSSGIITEIFLHTHRRLTSGTLSGKAQNHKLFSFVDDILLIFDSEHTNIQVTVNDFNTTHPKLHFTAEIESNKTINYLDISIHRTPTNLGGELPSTENLHLPTPSFPTHPPTTHNTNTPL